MKERITCGNATTRFEKGCAVVSGIGLGVAVSTVALPIVISASAFTVGAVIGVYGVRAVVDRERWQLKQPVK